MDGVTGLDVLFKLHFLAFIIRKEDKLGGIGGSNRYYVKIIKTSQIGRMCTILVRNKLVEVRIVGQSISLSFGRFLGSKMGRRWCCTNIGDIHGTNVFLFLSLTDTGNPVKDKINLDTSEPYCIDLAQYDGRLNSKRF